MTCNGSWGSPSFFLEFQNLRGAGSWLPLLKTLFRPFLSSFHWGFNPTVLCRSETPQLFTVLPEKRTATVGGAMMGSTHIYDMSTVSTLQGVGGAGRLRRTGQKFGR